jgi:hypothetical protein
MSRTINIVRLSALVKREKVEVKRATHQQFSMILREKLGKIQCNGTPFI